MDGKLFESELKVMEVLWEHESLSAKEISEILAGSIGWNKNTTYTVIKKCIDKGAASRTEPGFICKALIEKDEVRQIETEQLIDRLFGGSGELFFSSFLKSKGISKEEAAKLAKLIEEDK